MDFEGDSSFEKMSSTCSILGDRPIDQLKVTELKEELRRRKLSAKGLKEDLIERLNEAISKNSGEKVDNTDDGDSNSNPRSSVQLDNTAVTHGAESGKEGCIDATEEDNGHDAAVEANSSDDGGAEEVHNQGDLQNQVVMEEEEGDDDDEDVGAVAPTSASSPEAELNQNLQKSDSEGGHGNGAEKTEQEDHFEPQVVVVVEEEDEGSGTRKEDEVSKSKPSCEIVDLNYSPQRNQVSAVNPNLGFQVKSDSLSSDSVSVTEMAELKKDNIIADHVNLELDVRSEMVDSLPPPPLGGESESSPLMDNEEKDDGNTSVADANGGHNDSLLLDVGYSEKLNLDRSSGDDSMEEDEIGAVLDVGDKGKCKISAVLDIDVDVVGNGTTPPPDHNQTHLEEGHVAEKRKLYDQETAANAEPLKRQRRWSCYSDGFAEAELPNSRPICSSSSSSRDAFKPVAANVKQNSINEDAAPKERFVPPSQRPPTNSLKVDKFLRPFTLKAVQELLGKTGEVVDFWMDHIKTHCFVTYSSVEEAVSTRNAVYNLQWPANGGRLLVAEFVDSMEVKMRVHPLLPPPPPLPPLLLAPLAIADAASLPPPPPPVLPLQPSPRQLISRQQLPPPPPLPQLPLPPPMAQLPAKERTVHLPPPPPLPSMEKYEPPLVTLDDLFRKTKATPRIYYLPLSEDLVSAKLAAEKGNGIKL